MPLFEHQFDIEAGRSPTVEDQPFGGPTDGVVTATVDAEGETAVE
jgi:hypothetical protein